MTVQTAMAPERSDRWRNADDHVAGATRYLEMLTALIQSQKDRSIELLNLEPGHSVIEIGCGLGRECEAMARTVGPAGKVVGIDASQALLDQATARTAPLGLSLAFQRGDAHKLPFADDTFDAARGERVFEHLRDPQQAVRELARVVRPGGRIAGLEPDFETIAIAGVPLDVTRAILRHKTDIAIAHGTIGREMRGLLANAGCIDLYSETSAVTLLTLQMADDVLSLRANVDGAVAQRFITEEQGNAWWHRLQQLDRKGGFLVSLCGMFFAGTVPGGTRGGSASERLRTA